MELLKARPALLLIAALTAALLSTLACSDDDETGVDDDGSTATPTTPADGPHIRGDITTKTDSTGDNLGTLLIEGAIQPDTDYDKASVRIDADTEIFAATGNELSERTWDDLQVGDLVEATFEGPVAESYPVQAYASRIVILTPTASPTP